MSAIPVRELERQVDEIIRQVRDEREPVEIVERGAVIARIVPAERTRRSDDEVAGLLADLDRIAARVSVQWPDVVSAVDAVREVRRDL